jgi:aminopeptidase C
MFLPIAPCANPRSICRFVYQVVVPKALAPKELVKVYESDDKVVLPAWDPMVSCRAYDLCQSLDGSS